MIERARLKLGTLLDGYTRRFRLADHFLGMFIPYDLRGDTDAVRALAPRILSRLKKPPACIMLSQAVDCVRSASLQAGLSNPPFRVVLFAHPNESENGFAINPSEI